MLIEAKKNHSCPLCGDDNSCAVAESGSFDVLCWCRSYTIKTATLERLPETQRNESCICRKCAVKSEIE
jgi:hypothetical protein